MPQPQLAGVDYQEGRALDQQGQLDPSYTVSQLTSSHEAMKCLGEALSRPLISSLQAAGAIPSRISLEGAGTSRTPSIFSRLCRQVLCNFSSTQALVAIHHILNYFPQGRYSHSIRLGGQPS